MGKKLTKNQLKHIHSGLKKCLQKSYKLNKHTSFNMSSYLVCAMAQLFGTRNASEFQKKGEVLFGFTLQPTTDSKDFENLSNIQKDVCRLFAADGFPCEFKNLVSLSVWKKQANKVLEKVERRLNS